MVILKALFDALFGAVIAGIRTWQADRNLEKLGYTEGQRDVAVSQIKTVSAAFAARAAVRDDADSLRADPDNRNRNGAV